MSKEVTVSYTFRIVDEEALNDALNRLISLDDTLDLGDEPTDEDVIEALITDKDLLAIELEQPLGWLHFGLERIE